MRTEFHLQNPISATDDLMLGAIKIVTGRADDTEHAVRIHVAGFHDDIDGRSGSAIWITRANALEIAASLIGAVRELQEADNGRAE